MIMEYAKLGNTDIEVSKICVGCMSFGKAGTLHDWTVDETEAEKIVNHALDLGINFFDTANFYTFRQTSLYGGLPNKTLKVYKGSVVKYIIINRVGRIRISKYYKEPS